MTEENPQKPGQKLSCPCPVTLRELVHHYPSLPFSFVFLSSIHWVKIIAVSTFFSGQHFGTRCLQQIQPQQFSAYLVASECGAASG